jgi:hypothetical protein
MAKKYRFFHILSIFFPHWPIQLAASSPFWIETRGVCVVLSLIEGSLFGYEIGN